MRAYLIDPANQSVSEVDYDGDYRSIYKLIGVDCFTAARFNENDDTVWVDDEGLLKDPKISDFFEITGYPQPLAGKGLVLGNDAEGESIAPSVDLNWLRSNVSFFLGRGIKISRV